MNQKHLNQTPISGVGYFIQGFHLAMLPKIRRFVLIPLLLNILIIGGAFSYILLHLDVWVTTLVTTFLPNWLNWLYYLLMPLITISFIISFSYLFSILANLIAAPFNGLLAECLEAQLTAQKMPDTSIRDLIYDMPRIFKREWQKLSYYIPKIIGLFIFSFIPIIGQTIGPLLWFVFSSWMMCIQYSDYAFDNHKVSFKIMSETLKQHRSKNFTFGATVLLCTMIPLLNIVIMPVAVCGATAMWVDQYRDKLKHPHVN